VERAKRALSSQPFAAVEEEFLAERGGAPLHLSLELRRDEYEEMIRPLVDRSMASVQTALHDAKLLARDIDRIILVGGATRTPLIQRLLAERTGIEPRFEVDPDLCVALGAASEGALIAGEEVHSVLVDITSHSMGVRCLCEDEDDLRTHYFSRIIPKGSPLPTSHSEVYGTIVDEQKTVEVEVYQGEDEDVRRNSKLGTFRIEGLAPVPAGNEIVVHFNLTLDGTLTVKAAEKATGLHRQIVIDDAIHSFGAEERERAQRRLEVLQGRGGSGVEEGGAGEAEGPGARPGPEGGEASPAAVLGGETGKEILRTVARVRDLLENMVPEDREEAVDLIERTMSNLEAGRTDVARAAGRDLEEMLFYLEEA